MKVIQTALPEVLVLEPVVFRDARGAFVETYNRALLAREAGIDRDFVQENQSDSVRHVLRGLHYQIRQPQGKLVRVVEGSVYDVAVDIRRGSSRFGRWAGVYLSGDQERMAWIPPGFAHGFLVLSEWARFLYKITDYWAPEHERCIAWNDPEIGIEWPLEGEPILSTKDREGVGLREAEVFP
jgi:dTDP-4-dehydrorhamnose 3,5-epimerase